MDGTSNINGRQFIFWNYTIYIFYISPVHFIFSDVSNIGRRPLVLAARLPGHNQGRVVGLGSRADNSPPSNEQDIIVTRDFEGSLRG